MGAWATGPAQPMQGAGAGKGSQVPRGCWPLSSPQEALLIPCLLLLGFCILLSKFDFAHNLDRHLSPAAGTGQSLTATVPPWTAALVPSGVVVVAAAALLNSGQSGGGWGQGGGPRWGRHSHSQQLRSPSVASAAAASAALVSLLDRLLVASLISTRTAVSPCVCPCEQASERAREQALLRHAAQPQPLRSACALEPTPCLIIQDMSTAFHRRALAWEAGARPGRENPRPTPALDGGPGIRGASKTPTIPCQLWGPQIAQSQATQGMRLCSECPAPFPSLFPDHTPQMVNQPHLLASLTPDSSLQLISLPHSQQLPENSLREPLV